MSESLPLLYEDDSIQKGSSDAGAIVTAFRKDMDVSSKEYLRISGYNGIDGAKGKVKMKSIAVHSSGSFKNSSSPCHQFNGEARSAVISWLLKEP